MVACSITKEVAFAVPAERLWKGAFAPSMSAVVPKACAGFIDAVEVDGDGGPGSVTTMKLNPSVGEVKTLKSRVVAYDAAARVVKMEVLEAGPVSAQLKTHFAEVKVEAAGEGASVAKVKVDYEHVDGAALAPEDEAKLTVGYVQVVKMVEAYLIANPNELA